MVRHASLFSQLVALFSGKNFYELVYQHQSERFAKKFNSWDHFVSMLFCRIAQAKSLREICGGLACCMGKMRRLGMKQAPNKSTLSYANTHRPWQMFQDLFYDTLNRYQAAAPGKHKFRFKNKLLSLDSAIIPELEQNWTFFKGLYVSNGKKHETAVARNVSLSPESIVALDRGYNDYSLFADWTENGIYFVTRIKDNADYAVIHEFEVPANRNILSDQLILFTGYYSQKKYPYPLRKIVEW